jgi:hypothetical protein
MRSTVLLALVVESGADDTATSGVGVAGDEVVQPAINPHMTIRKAKRITG